MNKEFVWTDDLVKEFILKECNKYNTWSGSGVDVYFEKFKASKTAVPEWEVISYGKSDDICPDELKNECITLECPIYSVRRRTDGLIISIGDTVSISKGIKFVVGRIFNEDHRRSDMFCSDLVIYNGLGIEKIYDRVPLFITEDEVKIFDRDTRVFVVDPRSLRRWNIYAHAYDGGGNLCFSTKESVEEYVINNKPCLSISEVINIDFGDTTYLKKELIELVKKKL